MLRALPVWGRFPLDTRIELEEGQKILVNAAKYLYKRWSTTPIRSADINDKLAYDKLIWLVHNFDFENPVFFEAPVEVNPFGTVANPLHEEGWVDISDRSATATF